MHSVIKFTSETSQVFSSARPACPFSNQSLVYGLFFPPNQPRPPFMNPLTPPSDISEADKNELFWKNQAHTTDLLP